MQLELEIDRTKIIQFQFIRVFLKPSINRLSKLPPLWPINSFMWL